MTLKFLSPLYLFGLLGITVPILIHLLTRRQKKYQLFSAVYLLLQSKKKSIKRSVPNQKFLLFIRCLGIVLLSLAMANPIFSFSKSNNLLPNIPSANVFILDDSYSMGNQSNQKSYYNLAIEALLDMIQSLSNESIYSIVLGSRPSRVLQVWNNAPSKTKNLFKLSQPTARRTEIGSAIIEAFRLLESAPQKIKKIYILTDRDKNGWNEEKFLKINEKLPYHINIIDFSEMRQGANAAVVNNIEVRQEFLSNSRAIKVTVKVTNLSKSKPIKKLKASLWINGKKQSEGLIDIPAKSSTEKIFFFPLQENIALNGEVRIEDDALLIDNIRYFNYLPDQSIKVLVVDGDPKTIEHQSETFYLERALNPFSASLSNIEPTLTTLAELPEHDLFNYSGIILCNIRNLSFSYEQELEKFVTHGGAMFISLGDQVDAKFYNEKLGNILPVYLKTVHQIGKNEEPFRFHGGPSKHPVLNIFKGQALEEMRSIKFNSIYSVEPREESDFSTPMVFENEFPALIESTIGKGKVILFTSSIDRDWNNFSIQPTFLPWIQRWIKYSVRGLDNLLRKELLVGEPFYWRKNPNSSKNYIISPKKRIIPLFPKEDKTIFTDTYRPGVYQLYRGTLNANTKDGTAPQPQLPSGATPVGFFTVNIDPKESLSEKISIEEIKNLLPVANVTFSNGYQKRDASNYGEGLPMFTNFILLVGLMLLLEGWLVRKE